MPYRNGGHTIYYAGMPAPVSYLFFFYISFHIHFLTIISLNM